MPQPHNALWPALAGDIRYISAPPGPDWVGAAVRTLALLGSTGSIGCNALKVAASQPGRFRVAALAGARNVRLLAEQAAQWQPPCLGVLDSAAADALRPLLPLGYRPRILTGQDGYAEIASLPEADTVLSAQVGAAGLKGTVSAALAGKVICLANKESLVLAGELVRHICARTGASILPVDSEHNAIFQALAGRPAAHVRTIILTASGGPFHGKGREALARVTREQALNHPNWNMGAKITIDSATLMNKGLEVIEAFQLYNAPLERISVLVHPQSLVHSLVEFADGSLMAHLGTPDMRMPLAQCLCWPHCPDVGVAPLDLAHAGTLTFAAPDLSSFPCLALAKRALRRRNGRCVTLNAANEAAVALFLEGRIGFMDIPALIGRALDELDERDATGADALPLCLPTPDMELSATTRVLDAILALDTATRRLVHDWAAERKQP